MKEKAERDFDDWLADLTVCLMKDGGMTSAQAEDYAKDREAWKVYYDDNFTPDDAVYEDMSYWGE
jgi:hypothetical protein